MDTDVVFVMLVGYTAAGFFAGIIVGWSKH